MDRSLLEYAKTAFPGHTAREIRAGADTTTDQFSTIATFESLVRATTALDALPAASALDLVEVVELRRRDEGEHVLGPDPQGPSGLRLWRVFAGSGVGSLVLGVAGALIAWAADMSGIGIAFSAIAGVVLGSFAGAAFAGLGRFGGAHATEQAPLPQDDGLALVAVHSTSRERANAVSGALATAEPIDLRVYLPSGEWFAPAHEQSGPLRSS